MASFSPSGRTASRAVRPTPGLQGPGHCVSPLGARNPLTPPLQARWDSLPRVCGAAPCTAWAHGAAMYSLGCRPCPPVPAGPLVVRRGRSSKVWLESWKSGSGLASSLLGRRDSPRPSEPGLLRGVGGPREPRALHPREALIPRPAHLVHVQSLRHTGHFLLAAPYRGTVGNSKA